MDLAANIVALVTAILLLTAAIYGYLGTRSEIRSKSTEPTLILLRVTIPVSTPSPTRRLHRSIIEFISSLLIVIFSLFSGISELGIEPLDKFVLIIAIYNILVGYLFILVASSYLMALVDTLRVPSKGIPQAQAEIAVSSEDYNAVQAHCIAALKAIKASIDELDVDNKIIKAIKGPWRQPKSQWRLSGLVDEITISIQRVEDCMVIKIDSRGIMPSLKPNVRRHQLNVHRVIDYLICC